MNCKFCGRSEEVEMQAVDVPGNKEPICLGCWEKFMDAAHDERWQKAVAGARYQFNQEDN